MTSLHVCHHFPICPWGGSLDVASKDKALLSLIVIVQQSSSFVFAWLCIVLRCCYYCSVSESESHFQQVLIDSLRYSMLNSLELTQVIHVLARPSVHYSSIHISFHPLLSKHTFSHLALVSSHIKLFNLTRTAARIFLQRVKWSFEGISTNRSCISKDNFWWRLENT